MRAAKLGDSQRIEQYVSNGSDINARSDYGWTALMFASWQGHEQVVERLLDAGADPNIVSQRIARNTQAPTPKSTALAEAIRHNHLSIAEKLMTQGAHMDPMAVALAGGLVDSSLLKKMHANGADLTQDAAVVGLSTPLNSACENGRLENVKWIIEQNVDPDAQTLQFVAGLDHLDILQYLMAQNATRNHLSEPDLSTALWHAATKQNTPEANFTNNLKVIKLLIANGANKNYKPRSGYGQNSTALEFLTKRRVEAVERINLNPYGPEQQEYEKKWLRHRDSIISLLGS